MSSEDNPLEKRNLADNSLDVPQKAGTKRLTAEEQAQLAMDFDDEIPFDLPKKANFKHDAVEEQQSPGNHKVGPLAAQEARQMEEIRASRQAEIERTMRDLEEELAAREAPVASRMADNIEVGENDDEWIAAAMSRKMKGNLMR